MAEPEGAFERGVQAATERLRSARPELFGDDGELCAEAALALLHRVTGAARLTREELLALAGDVANVSADDYALRLVAAGPDTVAEVIRRWDRDSRAKEAEHARAERLADALREYMEAERDRIEELTEGMPPEKRAMYLDTPMRRQARAALAGAAPGPGEG